nr:MAG TPA: hypothetical protein [Caudoviricetes sp.]DAX39994.1 MAG TPA: hypothetical protein [Caudoviricetes sp.]
MTSKRSFPRGNTQNLTILFTYLDNPRYNQESKLFFVLYLQQKGGSYGRCCSWCI